MIEGEVGTIERPPVNLLDQEMILIKDPGLCPLWATMLKGMLVPSFEPQGAHKRERLVDPQPTFGLPPIPEDLLSPEKREQISAYERGADRPKRHSRADTSKVYSGYYDHMIREEHWEKVQPRVERNRIREQIAQRDFQDDVDSANEQARPPIEKTRRPETVPDAVDTVTKYGSAEAAHKELHVIDEMEDKKDTDARDRLAAGENQVQVGSYNAQKKRTPFLTELAEERLDVKELRWKRKRNTPDLHTRGNNYWIGERTEKIRKRGVIKRNNERVRQHNPNDDWDPSDESYSPPVRYKSERIQEGIDAEKRARENERFQSEHQAKFGFDTYRKSYVYTSENAPVKKRKFAPLSYEDRHAQQIRAFGRDNRRWSRGPKR